MSKPKEIVIPNRITAAEANKLAPNHEVIEDFLSKVYSGIRAAATKNEKQYVYSVYNEAIGNVNVLYFNSNASKEEVLTLTGLECVKILEQDGYKVDLDLYYYEGQLVDIRLQFTISW